MAREVNRNELRDIRLCYFRERRIAILGAHGRQGQPNCIRWRLSKHSNTRGVSRIRPYGSTHWSVQVAGSSITSVDLPCDKSEDRKTTRIASSLVNSPRFSIKGEHLPVSPEHYPITLYDGGLIGAKGIIKQEGCASKACSISDK